MKSFYKKLILVLFFLILLNPHNLFSQVLISNSAGTPNGSAMLEIESTTKGMLIPRMTTTQRNTLGNLATTEPGLLVFDTDSVSFFIYGKTAKGINGWVNLSNGGTVWEKSGNNIYLASSNYNVGIGTNTPNRKFVLKAENDNDTLFEIQDKDGKPLMLITPTLTKFYFNKTTKGIAGGFAVGRYASAKALSDTALFIVTPDSTRVYTSGAASTVEAGGFAVGRYATAKGSPIKFFNTNIHNTRVYTDGDATKGIAGGFAVGRYASAKGENAHKYFYADIDSTRIYTDGSGTKGIAGGFAVGRYATAKAGGTDNYMYMIPDNYFIGHQSGDSLQNSNYTGKYNTFFGYKTGLNDTIAGSNVFIGYKSGMNTTGLKITSPSVDTLGSRNVFLGYETGLNNDIGSDNVLLGYKAGHELTTAGNNISIGSNAGYNNKNNSDNIFIGEKAGFDHVGTGFANSANNNIFIGLEAGAGDNTHGGSQGKDNVFMGTESGKSIFQANYNVFIGYQTGLNIKGIASNPDSGHKNVFIGYQAGLSNIGGANNVFIGSNSGEKNQYGYSNTFLGENSGYSCASSVNTFVGYNSGKYHTTGYANIYIGNSAGQGQINDKDLGESNVYIGNSAGQNNYTGKENVFVGHNAGILNREGIRNVFIGYQAGYHNSGVGTGKGDYNVFMGYKSGFSNIDGFSNIFIGNNSGNKAVDSVNTYIGKDAGKNQVYGDHNTYLGAYAGSNATGGSNNIFIGTKAGDSNSSNGVNNVFIGNSSGEKNTSGRSNVFLGMGSGNTNTTGANNVFLGVLAGQLNDDGQDNVFIGPASGNNNGGGIENTYIGSQSGMRNVDGSNNVFIGNKAGSYETGSDKFYIANTGGSNLSTGISSSLMYGDFNTETLRINAQLSIYDAYKFPIADGAANQVLVTNGGGVLSWANTSTLPGDNLGNHSATQDLDMNAYNITDVDKVITLGVDDYDKLRVWSSYYYSIGMHSSMSLGYLNSYAMTFSMYNTADGGWVWRDNNDTQSDGAMSLTTDGRLFVKSTVNFNGNVGIGLSSPSYNLDIFKNSSTSTPMFRLYQSSTSGDASVILKTNGGNEFTIGIDASDSDKFKISDNTTLGSNDRFVITSSGYTGVGTSTPDYPFEVEGSNAGSNTGDNRFISMFKNNGGIYSDGIKVQAGGVNAATTGDVIYMFCSDGDGDWVGSVYSSNGTLYMNGKSAKKGEKYDIKETNKGLNIIRNLQVVDYNFDAKTNTYKTGFVGEDVLKVFPAMVHYEKEANEYGVANSALIPVLTKGMQEQQIQIEELKNEINNLKEQNMKIESLEKQIKELRGLIQDK